MNELTMTQTAQDALNRLLSLRQLTHETNTVTTILQRLEIADLEEVSLALANHPARSRTVIQ